MTFLWNILGYREKLDENGVFLTKLTIITKCWKSHSCKKYMSSRVFLVQINFSKKLFQKKSYNLIRFYYRAILSKNLIWWSNFYTQLRYRKKNDNPFHILQGIFLLYFIIEWKSDIGYKNILKSEKSYNVNIFWDGHKIWENLPLVLTFTHFFVAFSENLNFNRETGLMYILL